MKTSLFIPTYNAVALCGDRFAQNLSIIKSADLDRVLIIDSSSIDNTVDVVKNFGFECQIIPKQQFDHGGTRCLASEILSDTDIIVYLTQDVVLQNTESLTKLIAPLLKNENIASSYGRQLAHVDADVYARHLRRFNYPKLSYTRKYDDRYVYGMRTVFSSDSFAAYRIDFLRAIGGFPKHLIMGEDVYMAAKFLKAGYQVAYVAEAVCYHSHNYGILEDFQRYFDIGVFHRAEGWIRSDFGTANKDGLKFVLSEIKFVLLRQPWALPKSLLKIIAKYLGYKIGTNYDEIGVRLCRKFSMNKHFWW